MMVVVCCCWVSRAHGVEDVHGGFSVSMMRWRNRCFRCGSPGLLVGEGRWVEGNRPVGSIWVFFGDILAEKRGSKQWSGSSELPSGYEVVYRLFSVGVGWFQVGLIVDRKVGDGGCENGKNRIV
ncbi:hypothetical protein KY289_002950 [Solanum tuberosum]|nr:hypothetical protein KY289_002950 [Solanum tuberosum]